MMGSAVELSAKVREIRLHLVVAHSQVINIDFFWLLILPGSSLLILSIDRIY